MTGMVWRCINLVWMSPIEVNLSSYNGVFAQGENELTPHFQIIFKFLRYWELWFNWNMQNAFTFDSHFGVRIYCKVKRNSFVAIDSLREVMKS